MTKRKNEMVTYVMEVTPELAKGFLEQNTVMNRNLSATSVAKLAEEEMRMDRWRLTHEAIAFDADGRLIDGQHRLAAVVQSGATCMMLIAENCDPETFRVIGSGRARSSSDLFVISYKRKYGDAPVKATYITSVAAGMLGGLVTTEPSREAITETALKHYRLISRLVDAFDRRGVKDVLSTRVVAAFANASLYFGAAKIDPLVERVTTQMWAAADDPLKALYSKLQAAKIGEARDRRARLTKNEQYAVGVSAIRAALSGERRTKLLATTQDVGEAEADKRIRRGTAPSLAGAANAAEASA